MNNRIQELIRLANVHIFPDESEYGHKIIGTEKFAEYILQDIDKIINDLYHDLPLEQAVVLLTLDEHVKEHFYGTRKYENRTE